MKVSQTKRLRAFSAISSVMPVSMPMTSVSYQFLSGLKASTIHSATRLRLRNAF